MQPLSNRKKVLEQKPMNFMERIYFPAIVKGLSITLRHFFKKYLRLNIPSNNDLFLKILEGNTL